MSFSNANCNRVAGSLKGNALTGLCEKVSIQVDKIFDSCISQETLTDVNITLTNITPSTGLTEPYRFISGGSTTVEASITDLVVSELPDNCYLARITGNVIVPIRVVFVDANGTQGTADAQITIPKDVVMHVSAPSVIPYAVQASVNLVVPEGTFTTATTLTVSACATVILKVVMPVQLLVPSYGYTYIPPCQNYTDEVCSGVFDLPLYPEANLTNNAAPTGDCHC